MKYIIVEGWEHNDFGDDQPFMRGFQVTDDVALEQFNKYFAKKIKGPVKNDFKARFVTKEEYTKFFREKH